MSEYKSPVYNVLAVPIEKITANDYNPNAVAPPEMALLEISIWEDGYTQPVVACYDEENDKYVVVDGFHRYLTIKNSERIYKREKGLLPIVLIDKQIGDRMASTIRHNRARGTHNVELMSTIVSELVEMGKGDRWICKHIGMSVDELLRLKQITGVAALFANRDLLIAGKQKVFKRVYRPYYDWEEINHNMWGCVQDRKLWLKRAIKFTSDHKKYGRFMMRVIHEWPVSCENALTDKSINRKAWVGHAAAALALGCPEDITRQAWGELTDEQQLLANKKADRAIAVWEYNYYLKNRGIHTDMDGEMLF